jgi:hypothetical protein
MWALAQLALWAVMVFFARQTQAKFDFVGVNEAGPEFGDKKFPGIKEKDVSSKPESCQRRGR